MDIAEFQKLNPLDPAAAAQIEAAVGEIINSESVAYAEEYLEFLNKLLQTRGKEIEAKSPELYDKYQNFWVRLAFLSFPVLDSIDQDNLLKTRILHAVQQGYDPDRLVADFFYYFESEDFIKEAFRGFAKSMEQNTEQFGNQPIMFEGKRMIPSLKYWIQDYAKFPSKNPKRGGIERLNYLNQSPNTRALTQVYKQQLMKVLKFYDDLNNAERPLNKTAKAERNMEEIRRPQPAAAPTPETHYAPVPLSQPQINIDSKLEELKTRAIK